MNSIGNIIQQNNPYEKFVQQLVQLESRQKLQFEAQQKAHRERKTALGEVSSAISKFVSKISEFENPANNAFKPLTTSSSDESVVRVNSAAGIDRASNYNITIDRLASNDIALSQVMAADGFELAAEGGGSVTISIGDKTETIILETTKENEDGITVDKTNKEILDAFADEISNLLGDDVRASVFQVNNQEVQFSLQSLETGFENRIQISDSSGALAHITDNINHLTAHEELNAKFTVDGVNFERSTNTIEDAITGLSFTLMRATGEQEQMSVQRDLKESRSNIESFISAFNELNKTIRDRTFVDAENDRRGALQKMRPIRNLTFSLRQTALLPMEGVDEGQLVRLSEIGIGFEKNGTMHIEDSELLNEMLEQRPDEIANLFSQEGSTISRMKEEAEAFTTANTGIIASLENGLDQQISRLDTRIAAQERHLEQYEERQRAIFNELQLILERGQAQFDQIMSFRSNMGFF